VNWRGCVRRGSWPNVRYLPGGTEEKYDIPVSGRPVSRLTEMLFTSLTHRPDDGGSKLLWNVGQFLPEYCTMQHPRTQSSVFQNETERLQTFKSAVLACVAACGVRPTGRHSALTSTRTEPEAAPDAFHQARITH